MHQMMRAEHTMQYQMQRLASSADWIANQPIVGATGMVVIRRVKADPLYRVAVPF